MSFIEFYFLTLNNKINNKFLICNHHYFRKKYRKFSKKPKQYIEIFFQKYFSGYKYNK